MKVSFGENAPTSGVFQNFINTDKFQNPACYSAQVKPDTIELTNSKKNVKNNKKLIAGMVIAGAAISGAVLLKKNYTSLVKNIKKLQNFAVKKFSKKDSRITENLVKNAKKFLVDNIKEEGTATANGISFYGPDSLGKEQAINSLLESLQQAGYKVEHAPRAKDAPSKTIGGVIRKLEKEAENRFNETKQRTVIVVRDLDKIALERRLEKPEASGAVAALLDMDRCRYRGFSWIGEAVDLDKVDYAVLRPGRLDHNIPARPSVEDSKEVWSLYLSMLEKIKDPDFKKSLLKEAKKIMTKKGI